MGVVIEKEADVICVYGTNNTNTKILCAIPLCHPKFLKGERFTVEFNMKECAMIRVKDIKVSIYFKNHTCSTNVVDLRCHGSDEWDIMYKSIGISSIFRNITEKANYILEVLYGEDSF